MNRSIFVLVGAELVALAALAWAGYRVHAADRSDLQELTDRLDRLADDGARPAPVAAAGTESVEELERVVDELRVRLANLETGSRRTALAVTTDEEQPTGEPEVADEAEEPGAPNDPGRSEFDGILAKLIGNGWDFSDSRDDFERFLELARGTDYLDERLADLEHRVTTDPGDVEGRMELAQTYVGKLMTVSGPEQGLWGGRAEDQWRAVVELDDDHWDAHSSLGTNYSYYPEVMGKTEEAILHLERARSIQRFRDPEPEHVQTYLFLARMLDREGKRDEARGALIEGLQYHSGNAPLEAALARLD